MKTQKEIEKLKSILISRICRPNKLVNTFQNAREQERIINEEFKELLSKIGGKE